MNLKNELEKKQYDFLRNKKELGDNIVLLALGGSRAYKTNIEDSDIDIKGIAINEESNLLGLGLDKFECYSDEETDTVIYGLDKFFKMLMKGNPTAIEMLFCPEDCILYKTDIGDLILKNKRIFLSKYVIPAFKGFISGQEKDIKRLENQNKEDNKNKIWKKRMGVLRLYLTLIDLLSTGKDYEEFIVCGNFLKEIRMGNLGEKAYFDLKNTLHNLLEKIIKLTDLPEEVNKNKINELLININKKILLRKWGLYEENKVA
ncbi:nucleotidyltransferase domain-containing protein [Clostridium perfringens]|nr:nucleotidyltransferase domain-containing protein [Clostridium perfringens]MDK0983057.1 nucleotidyltransferase domain-containing protein [Clostridium perfringens]